MKNPARQEIHCAAAPPTSIPRLAPMPAVAAYQATARERCSPSGKLAVSSESADGATTAAPTPCRARPAMSHHPLGATPMRNDAVTNTTKAADEHAAATEEVTQAGTEQQQPAEHERVRVLHPGQPGRTEIHR